MVDQKIGRYRIVRLIGKGGMGAVYEATDEEIQRRAAIKILHSQYTANAEMASRFLNEARAVNIIQHPSLVSAFEFGKLPDGAAYMVMEYLDGETLRERIKRQGSLGQDAIRIARQITSALVAAHAKRIVHRDLKPANIMIVADPDMPGGERVKVLDFGIAKLNEGSIPGQPETRTGALLGSPGYMSPEQCRNVSSVDERSDVYALGAILYEMLVGQPPFVAESDAEMLAMHMYSTPTPLIQVNPGIRPELSAFVERMLAKTPEGRPATSEVLQFLNEQAGYPAAQSMQLPIVNGSQLSKRSSGILAVGPPGTAPDSERHTNTLSRAAGSVASGPLRLTRVAMLGGTILILAAGLVWTQLGHRREPAQTPLAPTVSTTVLWQVDSTPTGATVVRERDQKVLGQTPLRLEEPRGTGQETLLLRLPGHRESSLALDRAVSRDVSVTLAASPTPPATTVAGSGTSERREDDKAHPRSKREGGKSKRGKGSKVTQNADIELIK